MKRYFILAIISITISCSPLRHYRDLPEVKAWETEIQKFEKLDRTETYPDNSLIFTGSSSIRRWATLAGDMAPYPVIQRGYGGAKLSDFAVYTDRILYPHECQAIVIFIANDINGGDADKTPREVLRLFRYVVKTIRKQFPDTPLFWIAITPTSSRWSVWPQIREANNLIKDYCDKQHNLYFIATENAFLNEEGKPRNEYFVSDLLHLNEDGYMLWTGIIKNELNKVLNYP